MNGLELGKYLIEQRNLNKGKPLDWKFHFQNEEMRVVINEKTEFELYDSSVIITENYNPDYSQYWKTVIKIIYPSKITHIVRSVPKDDRKTD